MVHDAFLYLIVVDCGTLPDPANGHVSHTAGTKFGQTATYHCNPGYNLLGERIRMCQATGVWSGSAPTWQCTLLLNMYQLKLHSKMLNFILYFDKEGLYQWRALIW